VAMRKRPLRPGPPAMNIGLFLPNWLGDVVMATPALRAIRRRFGPQARLVGIVRPGLVELLAGTHWLNEQWPFDPRSEHTPFRQRALVRRMRRERFDLAVLFPNSLRTAVLAWLGGARERIGYAGNARGPLLTATLAEAVGCASESPRLELASTEAEQAVGDAIWRDLGLRTDGRVIALNSSGAYGEAKLWPEEHFGELARRLADRLDHDVLVICGPQERELAGRIARHANRPRVFSLAEQPLGLAATKASIERIRLMVSTDSGPRHVAAAFAKPVVTLFGPQLPVWVANPTVRGVDLQLDLECIGCGRRTCPKGHHRCMRELSVDMVYAAVLKLLGEEAAGRAA
jgi:heptosyltransferase-2